MSTKIFNGKIVVLTSWEDIMVKISRLRVKAQLAAKKQAINLIIASALRRYVNCVLRTVNPKDKQSTPYRDAEKEYANRINKIKQTMRRDPEADLELKISFIPSKDKILALPFYEWAGYGKLLENENWMRDYGYWNNTEPDPECSNKEWNKRKKDWETALKTGEGRPGYNGLTAEIVFIDDFTVWSSPTPGNEEQEMVLDLTQSLQSHVRELSIQKKMKVLYKKDTGRIFTSKTPWLECSAYLYKAMDYYHAKNGTTEIEAGAQKLRSYFKTKIELDDLHNSYSEIINTHPKNTKQSSSRKDWTSANSL
jgi:hypothetical protein